jgi:hypothetical protein
LIFFQNSKVVGVEVLKQGKIHYSRTCFGDLKYLEEKRPQISKLKKNMKSTFNIIINLDNFVSRIFYPFLLHLGYSHFLLKRLEEMQKDRVSKSILMQNLVGILDLEFESCCVFKIRNTINAGYKKFPIYFHIFFYNRHKISLEIVGTSETNCKRGETIDLGKP